MTPSTAPSQTQSRRNACELLVVRHGLTDHNQIHRLQVGQRLSEKLSCLGLLINGSIGVACFRV